MEDSQLVGRVRDGDIEAFGELVRRYQRRAFAIAYRLLGHREDAEDLVQDSFMTALDKLDSYDAARPFGSWFFRILVNRGHNARASRQVRSTESLSHELGSTDKTAAHLMEQAELGERIKMAIGELSERQQLVVQLYELEGFSTAEVSDMLEIAEPTVRWTLHDARKRLRKELATWKEAHHDA